MLDAPFASCESERSFGAGVRGFRDRGARRRDAPAEPPAGSWMCEASADASASAEPSGASSRTRRTLSRRRPPGRGTSGSFPGAGWAVAAPLSNLTGSLRADIVSATTGG